MFSSNASGRTIYVPRASVDQYKEALKDTYKNGSGATTIEPYDFNQKNKQQLIKVLKTMNWTEAIIVNLVTIAIAVLGIVVAIVIYKHDKRNIRNRNTINRLANQVKAYYELEQLYVNYVATNTNTAEKTVLQNYRKMVLTNSNAIDPGTRFMAASEADKYIVR